VYQIGLGRFSGINISAGNADEKGISEIFPAHQTNNSLILLVFSAWGDVANVPSAAVVAAGMAVGLSTPYPRSIYIETIKADE
jgi:hypothetical protein